jgi:hypothetical protein
MDAMKVICKMVLEDIQKKQKRGTTKESKARPSPGLQATAAPEPPPIPRTSTEDAGARRPQAETSRGAERPARVEEASGIRRTVVLPVKGPGPATVSLGLPIELQLDEGVEAVQMTVNVQVRYLTQGKGNVLVRELAAEPSMTGLAQETPAQPQKKRRFFGLLSGGRG